MVKLIKFIVLFLWVGVIQANDLRYPRPPSVNLPCYLLVDFHTGKILAENNASEQMEPASLTKMMTAYVVDKEIQSGHIGLQDEVTVSTNAWRTEGSRMFIDVGSKVPVSALLRGVIVVSGNDASVALAEYIAGTEENFADLMNEYAKRLGMNNTHFVNSTGLPHPEHYTTAHDLATLARAIITEHPQTYQIYAEKEFTYNNISQYNRNKLLWNSPGVDGGKTGHTNAAGYCLTASALRNDMRLLAIAMGAKTDAQRTQEANKLLNWGFRFFQTHKIYQANTPLQKVRAWLSTNKEVEVGLAKDLYITLPYGQQRKLKTNISFAKELTAPLTTHAQVGWFNVVLNEQVILQQPLVTLREAPLANIWRRTSDRVAWYSKKLLGKLD